MLQTKKPPASPLEVEFEALQNAQQARQRVYLADYQKAKTDAEKSAIIQKMMAALFTEFYPRLDSLAKKAKGTAIGVRVHMEQLQLSSQANKPELSKRVVAAVLRDDIDQAELGRYIGMLPYFAGERDPKKTIALLQTIESTSKNTNVRAGALAARAEQLVRDPATAKQAAALYRQVIAQYPKTEFAKRAQSAIFEAENLQVGMVAPEITGPDHEGKTFKLSQYRGKVVVLDFWGFW